MSWPREVGASVADLGVLLPIAASLVVLNDVDPVAAFGIAGALAIASGLFYRVPIPVQPIKAAAAIAIATGASPEVLAGAGLILGGIMLVLALTGLARRLAAVFPKPIIRGNQLGVGVLLIVTSTGLARRGSSDEVIALVVFGVLIGVLAATEDARWPVALGLVAGGVAWSLATGSRADIALTFDLPVFHLPSAAALGTALTLLVIPQLPLTLGNAIVGTADIARDYHGRRARRVSETTLSMSTGAANVAVGLLGGMPLCHGSSGATAYRRFGGRTGLVSVSIGMVLLAAGLAFGDAAVSLFALIPFPVLAAMLAYTGIRHAALVLDQRGSAMAIAIAMGMVGGVTRNLMLGMAVGIPAYWLTTAMRGRATRAGSGRAARPTRS